MFYTIGVASQTNFDLNNSLKVGQFIFYSNDNKFRETNSRGIAFPGVIVLETSFRNNLPLITHETVHLFQQNDFSLLNTYTYNLQNNLNKIKIFNSINKFIHYDLEHISIYFINIYENNRRINYYDNFKEHEAGYFSNTLY